jgi:hypothetical protein
VSERADAWTSADQAVLDEANDGRPMAAHAWRIAEILASHVAHAADSAPSGEQSEEAIIEVALDCATGELIEAFGAETADRILDDERTYALCSALLTWHWQTGGAL